MALLDILPKQNIEKHLKIKDNKFNVLLKECALYGFNDLNKCCYIYEIYPNKQIDKYKYIVNDLNFVNRYYVSNIKNELKTDNIDIKFVDFNFD